MADLLENFLKKNLSIKDDKNLTKNDKFKLLSLAAIIVATGFIIRFLYRKFLKPKEKFIEKKRFTRRNKIINIENMTQKNKIVNKENMTQRIRTVKKERMTQHNNKSITVVYSNTCPACLNFMGQNIAKNIVGNEMKKIEEHCKKNNIRCDKHEISTNEAKELARKYNITAIPTIIIKKEHIVKKLVGGYPAEKLIKIYENLSHIVKKEEEEEESRKNNGKIALYKVNNNNVINIYYGPWCYYSRKLVGNKIVPHYQGKVNEHRGEIGPILSWCKKNKYNLNLVDHKIYPEEAARAGARGYPHTTCSRNNKTIDSIRGYMDGRDFVERLNQMIRASSSESFTQNGNKLVIVYADFCIWSKRLVGNKYIPSYEGSYDGKGPEGEYPELESKMKKRGYEVELINAEKNPDKAKEYGANGFPNIFIVKNGKIANTIPGFMNTKNIIEKYF